MGGQLDEQFVFSGSPLTCLFTVVALLYFVYCTGDK